MNFVIDEIIKKPKNKSGYYYSFVQVREKAALCLGCFCIGEPSFPHRMKVIRGLMDAAGVSFRQYRISFE